MRVDIQPHWKKIADWYWANMDPYTDGSIWDMLERDYGAVKVCHGVYGGRLGMKKQESIILFPDEQSYMMFMLKWS